MAVDDSLVVLLVLVGPVVAGVCLLLGVALLESVLGVTLLESVLGVTLLESVEVYAASLESDNSLVEDSESTSAVEVVTVSVDVASEASDVTSVATVGEVGL